MKWLLGALILIIGVLILLPPALTVDGVPEGFSEKRFDTGEVVLNYVEGPAAGPPVLLIPGQTEAWQGYKPVLAELASRFHVFVVDVRGHGKSSRTSGHYSYNSCGNDLRIFLTKVIGRPAIVSGLSSGAVLSVWLAANAPDLVRAIIPEDPPMFSSIWPRISEERFMSHLFRSAVETLGGPGERDPVAYLMRMGTPAEGEEELRTIPPGLARAIGWACELNREWRPEHPWDPPLIPFSLRAGHRFLSEYDVDFSRATLDGRLSQGFDPVDALRRVRCPTLLLHASWWRHPTWGLVGALDDTDVELIRDNVEDLRYASIDGGHEIHMSSPDWYIEQFFGFADQLNI